MTATVNPRTLLARKAIFANVGGLHAEIVSNEHISQELQIFLEVYRRLAHYASQHPQGYSWEDFIKLDQDQETFKRLRSILSEDAIATEGLELSYKHRMVLGIDYVPNYADFKGMIATIENQIVDNQRYRVIFDPAVMAGYFLDMLETMTPKGVSLLFEPVLPFAKDPSVPNSLANVLTMDQADQLLVGTISRYNKGLADDRKVDVNPDYRPKRQQREGSQPHEEQTRARMAAIGSVLRGELLGFSAERMMRSLIEVLKDPSEKELRKTVVLAVLLDREERERLQKIQSLDYPIIHAKDFKETVEGIIQRMQKAFGLISSAMAAEIGFSSLLPQHNFWAFFFSESSITTENLLTTDLDSVAGEIKNGIFLYHKASRPSPNVFSPPEKGFSFDDKLFMKELFYRLGDRWSVGPKICSGI